MILQAMLTRLYASLVHGPSMNAKPQTSRQRVDLMALEGFGGRSAGGVGGTAKASRIVARVACVAVEMQVRIGSRAGITLRCIGEGAELLVPNPALLAWLEQQTGQSSEELFQDEEGTDPWREL